MSSCTGIYFIACMLCSFELGMVETAASHDVDEMVDVREIIRELKTVKEILKSATIEIEKLKDKNENFQTAMMKMETKQTDELSRMKNDLEKLNSICLQPDVSAMKLQKDRNLQVFTDDLTVEVGNHTKINPSSALKDEDNGTLFNIIEPKSRLYEEKRLLLPQITTPGGILTKVAFYATVKESMHDLGFNQAISFETVVLDTHNAFHGTSGVFTAPHAGNYAFWGNVVCYANKYLEYYLVKNGVVITGGLCVNQGSWGSSTTMAAFHLNTGSKVWIRMDGNDHSSGNLIYRWHTSFLGFSLN